MKKITLYLISIIFIFIFNSNSFASSCDLSVIRIDGKVLNNFKSDIYFYSYETLNNSININSVSSEECIITGNGNFNLVGGINNIVITSINGDNISKYTISVNYKEIILDGDNKLSALDVFDGDKKIDIGFSSDITGYKINDIDSDSINIKASLSSSKSKFIDDFSDINVNLDFGKNDIYINVMAEDGKIKTYYLEVNRVDNRSSDNTLKSLSVNGKVINLKDNVFDYDITVRYNVESSNIKCISNDINAKIEFSDIKLVDGMNKIIIKVTSESGIKKNYSIIIRRLSEDNSKILLRSINVKDYDLGFNINKFDYNLKIDKETNFLEFLFDPKDEVRYEVLNNYDLTNGSSVIVICHDDEREYRYTINIIKDMDTIFGIDKSLFIISLIVSIILICGMTMFTILIVKKNKK